MLTIIARPTLDPERVDEIRQAMLELVDASLQEAGCIRYELHQDNIEPNKLTFVETWESRELWQQHMNGPAVKRFNEVVGDGIIAFELNELTRVSP